jgi:acyl-coenzyme A synthetase/AMP-(fatty) acid ligase
MSFPESKTDNLCYVDPETDGSLSYDQLLSALSLAPSAHSRLPETDFPAKREFSFIVNLLANVACQNDVYFEDGRVVTWRQSEFDFAPADDWESAARAIAQSASKIRLATSGTTGKPKQVIHSIASLTRGVKTGDHHQHDVWGLAYPLHHLAGLQVLFQSLFNQNPLVNLVGLNPDSVHKAIEDCGITHLSCTTTFLKLINTTGRSHPQVRRLTTGGEKFDESTQIIAANFFPNAKYRNIYALTEVGNLLISDGDLFTIPADLVGKLSVIDGCLAIHRSLLADGRITGTAKSSNPQLSPQSGENFDQWFITGDLVEIVSKSPLKFKFSTREVDIINVAGNKVIPYEIEQCLLRLPGVQQAAVYGMKNSVTGQIVVCDLVAKPGFAIDSDAIKRQLASQLPKYAVPRIIKLVNALRTTSSGKTCRLNKTS